MDNEKKLNIIGLIIKLAIAAPALIFSFIVMTSNVNGDSDPLLIEQFSSNSIGDSLQTGTIAINISIWVILIAVTLVLLFFLYTLVTRTKDAVKSILGIVISAIIFFIIYSAGTSDTIESLRVQGDISVTQGELNFTHAGIFTTLILLGIASVLAIFMSFIMRFIKN